MPPSNQHHLPGTWPAADATRGDWRWRVMRQLNGKRDDQECGDCVHILQWCTADATWYSCVWAREQWARGQGWALQWLACGLFAARADGTPPRDGVETLDPGEIACGL